MSRTKSWSILIIAALGLLSVTLLRNAVEQPSGSRAPVPGTSEPKVAAGTDLRIGDKAAAPQSIEAGTPAERAALARDGKSAPAAEVPQDKDEEGSYPGARVAPATIVRLHGDRPLTAEHPHIKPAIEIQERNTQWLMAHPAVVGTAVGLNDDGEVALVVLTKLEAPDLPRSIDGLPVVIWKSGDISSRHGVAREIARPEAKASSGTHTSVPPRQTKQPRPVPIGVSTGLPASETPGYWTAGTLGCRVKSAEGKLFALSNFHVYSWEGVAPLGSDVLQPGTLDSRGTITDGSDFLGVLTATVPIAFTTTASNEVDAAIALCGDTTLGSATLGNGTLSDGYGVPATLTIAPALGLDVGKYGRTTGYTLGTITTISTTILVGYDNGTAQFVHQIGISKRTRKSPAFSDSGDSGSLIVGSAGSNPVGLLFAGGTNSTFANPIGSVLTALSVTVDGK